MTTLDSEWEDMEEFQGRLLIEHYERAGVGLPPGPIRFRDVHDLAAVLAGVKPACLVTAKGPGIGWLLGEARRRGLPMRMVEDAGRTMLVAGSEAAFRLFDWVMASYGYPCGDPEGDRVVGWLMGYPEKAVGVFVEWVRAERDLRK